MAASMLKLLIAIVPMLNIIILLLPIIVNGLYADQAGKFDWRQQYIGKAKFINFEQTSQTGRSILVATEQNVLASLNARNGHIGWRSILETGDKGRIDAVIHTQNNNGLVTVQGGGVFVRSWQTTTGYLNWEYFIDADTSKRGYAALFGVESFDDSVAVLHDSTVTVVDMSEGHKIWSVDLPNSDSVKYKLIGSHDKELVVVGFTAPSGVQVVKYSKEGKLTSQKSFPDPWLNHKSKCDIFEGKVICIENQFVFLDFVRKPLQELGLSEDGVKSMKIQQATGQGFLVTINWMTRGFTILLYDKELSVLKNIPDVDGIHIVSEEDSDFFLAAKRTSSEAILVEYYEYKNGQISETSTSSQNLNVASHHGVPEQIYTLSFRKRDGSTGYKYLLAFTDHSISLLQQSGKMAWSREEGLASVINVEMLDLPVSENQAKMEDEFGSHEADIFSLFLKRIRTQISQMKTFVIQLQHKLKTRHHEGITDDEDDDDVELTRDDFSLHKMIILVSSSGKVYGMYSPTGKIVWRHLFPQLSPFDHCGKPVMPLFTRRTTAHFPHLPQVSILGKNKESGHGILITFDPITGASMNVQQLEYKVEQVALTAQVDEHFLRGVILLDNNRKLHVLPDEMKNQVADDAGIMFMFTVQPATGTVIGYGIKPKRKSKKKVQELNAEELWKLNFNTDSQTITHVVAKRLAEHVHSQGRVLGDRSVLYKYLNPNLVVISTEGIDSSKQGVISLYLVDVINGNVVFSVNHKRAIGPINIIHSENWIIYNYFNQKSRRNEMSVLELFEGNKQSNMTAFSSFTPPPVPLTMRQAYILPSSLATMTATITEKGITDKHLLLALKSGGILEIPKSFIDPRRPVAPTAEHREEGVIPYIPELPIMTESIVNHNQSMYNVREIYTSPAGLESTCLVLAAGLDLFYTRVAPSKMYDVLKDDFDYFFISSVLLSMIIVSVLTQKLAVRKALNRNWK